MRNPPDYFPSLLLFLGLIAQLFAVLSLLALFLTLLAPLIVSLYYIWSWLLPHLPSDIFTYLGAIYESASEEGKTSYKTLKNMLELLNFLSGPLLWITAIIAFIVTYRQLSESRKQRLSGVLIGISKDWDELEFHRVIIRGSYEGRAGDTAHAAGQMICDIVANRHPARDGLSLSSKANDDEMLRLKESVDTVLSYLEDVGHMCRKRYIKKNDVCDIIGNSIEQAIDILRLYIEEARRSPVGGTAIYANAIWLYRKTRRVRLFTVSGFRGS